LIVMIVSFFYTSYDLNGLDVSNKLQSTNKWNWLGKDDFGRDIFRRVMRGNNRAFLVGSIAVGIGLIFGTVIGSVAGYIGGWIDEIMMRIMDALMAFPGIILALMLVAVFGPGLVNTSIAIGLMTVPGIARIARSGF